MLTAPVLATSRRPRQARSNNRSLAGTSDVCTPVCFALSLGFMMGDGRQPVSSPLHGPSIFTSALGFTCTSMQTTILLLLVVALMED